MEGNPYFSACRRYVGRHTGYSSTMVLERFGTEWEGECGFGWVHLPDGRSSFARWASSEGHAFRSSPWRSNLVCNAYTVSREKPGVRRSIRRSAQEQRN